MQISNIFDSSGPIRQGDPPRLTLVASTTKPGKQTNKKAKKFRMFEHSLTRKSFGSCCSRITPLQNRYYCTQQSKIFRFSARIKKCRLYLFLEQPIAINDCIITTRLRLKADLHARIISIYTPTMTNDEHTKNTFYRKHTPAAEKILLLGDFNARVDNDYNIEVFLEVLSIVV